VCNRGKCERCCDGNEQFDAPRPPLMKHDVARSLLTALTLWLLSPAGCHSAFAQGTAFTYQGRLSADGTAASGAYDLRFRLATDPLANNYIGSPFLTNAVYVTNGLFTVVVDFGGASSTATITGWKWTCAPMGVPVTRR
jgi:hypothetical protein